MFRNEDFCTPLKILLCFVLGESKGEYFTKLSSLRCECIECPHDSCIIFTRHIYKNKGQGYHTHTLPFPK